MKNAESFLPQDGDVIIFLPLNVFLVPRDLVKFIFDPLWKVTKSHLLLSVTSQS